MASIRVEVKSNGNIHSFRKATKLQKFIEIYRFGICLFLMSDIYFAFKFFYNKFSLKLSRTNFYLSYFTVCHNVSSKILVFLQGIQQE